VVKLLVANGWLVKVGGGNFNPKTGKKTGTIYHVTSHEEWIKAHGSKGCDQSGNPDRHQSGNPDQSSLGIQTIPVSKSRHKTSGKTLCLKTPVETSGAPQPSKNSFLQGQEIKGEAHDVNPPSLDSQTGDFSAEFTRRMAEIK